MDMGQREVQAQAVGDGRYLASGNFLTMAGGWSAEVSIHRSGAQDQRVTFQVVVGQAPDTNRAIFSPARILVNALTMRAAAGAVALVLAVLVFLQILRLRRSRDRRMGLLLGGALLLVGMFVMGTSLAAAYRASLPNPVPATPASLVRGQQIYTANCASCHGLSGRGDGPAGFLLHPPPADLRVHMAAGHTDAQLFEWITQGVSGTGMPAFGQKLSREDIWNVVNYIRTFADPSPTTQ
jgi:mono/diheme cytochrome c family protein